MLNIAALGIWGVAWGIAWLACIIWLAVDAVRHGVSPVFGAPATSWGTVYISLGVAAALALLVTYLSRRLTKERIVLSSKG